MIVHTDDLITLIGGSDFTRQTLDSALNVAPFVVAADGGADLALAQGITPRAVIGDLDSLSAASLDQIPKANLHEIHEQDSTDFDKCMRNLKAPLIVAVGFFGGRMDHYLAALNTLIRHPLQRCVLLGADELIFLAPPSLHINLPANCRLSLFPMGAVEGVSDGLKWPLNGLNFAPDGQVSTSNQTSGPVHLSFTAPKMLTILPADKFDLVVAALLDSKSDWS